MKLWASLPLASDDHIVGMTFVDGTLVVRTKFGRMFAFPSHDTGDAYEITRHKADEQA